MHWQTERTFCSPKELSVEKGRAALSLVGLTVRGSTLRGNGTRARLPPCPSRQGSGSPWDSVICQRDLCSQSWVGEEVLADAACGKRRRTRLHRLRSLWLRQLCCPAWRRSESCQPQTLVPSKRGKCSAPCLGRGAPGQPVRHGHAPGRIQAGLLPSLPSSRCLVSVGVSGGGRDTKLLCCHAWRCCRRSWLRQEQG